MLEQIWQCSTNLRWDIDIFGDFIAFLSGGGANGIIPKIIAEM